ncbi:MAG: BamA/TamA family outer membrane protein [Saprospiraceae bacterium]|nr:BamA/TamA family outer membrane protein [Saprospiraceae bacterium]
MQIFQKALPVIFLILSSSLWVSAQKQYALRLLCLDQSPEFLTKRVAYKTVFPDSLGVKPELKNVLSQLHSQAFLEASVDTLLRQDSIFTAFLHVGPLYGWAQLRNGNIEEGLLSQVGFRERLYRGKPFSVRQIARLQESLLRLSEDNGFPFAQVRLDSIRISQGQVTAKVMMDRGQFVPIKQIKVTGNVRISRTYLENYLGLKVGTPYNRTKILRLRERLRELPFLEAEADPVISFEAEGAVVNLALKQKRASRFDFLIGILPNSAQTGRMLITGSFLGELNGQFGQGERIYVKFEQLRPQTQLLDLQFNYPYLAGLPFGADLQFNLYKRDTNYLDIAYTAGVQYLLEGGDYLKAFLNNRSSVLLKVDEAKIMTTQALPDTLDVSRSAFGIEYARRQLDYRFNPRRGWSLFLHADAGVRRIRRNSEIENLELGYLYDSLQERSFQYKLEGKIEAYLPLFRRTTLKTALQTGWVISNQGIYANEQYRIGGNRLLRGFDEELVFATNYTVLTLEYRLLLQQNSYLYAFGDYARVDERTSNTLPGTPTVDFPYGFGAGITFETSAGVFGVSLAFGSRKNNPLDFGAPKVHLGYVSLF